MSRPRGILARWSLRLRLIAYGFGFAGAAMMLVARGLIEPARTLWAQRAFICLGLMFGCFITNYVLSILRSYRR